MIRQSFCILHLFSGKFEVGVVYVFLFLLCFGKIFFLFLWERADISNQLKLQVLPGIFVDSKPIRNSLVTF